MHLPEQIDVVGERLLGHLGQIDVGGVGEVEMIPVILRHVLGTLLGRIEQHRHVDRSEHLGFGAGPCDGFGLAERLAASGQAEKQ